MDPSSKSSRTGLDVTELYTSLASRYGTVDVFKTAARHICSRVGLTEGLRVLDVACGRGACCSAALDVVGDGGMVVGVDITPRMVELCAEEFRGRASFYRMRAEELAFHDDTFDVVLCGYALFLFSDSSRAMAEMRRVLRPGGRVAVSTVAPERDPNWWWFVVAKSRHLGRVNVRWPYSHAPDLAEALEVAGFIDVTCEEFRIDQTYESTEEWVEDIVANGEGRFLADMSDEERKAFLAMADRKLSGAMGSDGLIHHQTSLICGEGAAPI